MDRWSGAELPGRSSWAPARPHRLEAKDTTLSRWRHGFESRWGCSGFLSIRAGQTLFLTWPYFTARHPQRPTFPVA
jgi:hypothetical protein